MPVYGFFWTEWLHGCIYVMLVLDPNYVTNQYAWGLSFKKDHPSYCRM